MDGEGADEVSVRDESGKKESLCCVLGKKYGFHIKR